MRLSSLFYKAVHAVNKGLTTVFNYVSGNKALADRGLVRGSGLTIAGAEGEIISSMAPLVLAAILIPVIGLPLAAIFGTAAAIGGVLIPARLEATAIIHAANNKKKPKSDIKPKE